MKTYSKSVQKIGETTVSMIRNHDGNYLLIQGPKLGFSGVVQGEDLLAPLTHENAVILRELFPFTAPKPVLSDLRTIGLGDRLGLANPGHLRALNEYDAVPVLAQQSIRELKLTNRTYAEVLNAATFAVYREGFDRGFGADGDHLKTESEIEYALESGFTMITLDCSEHIRNDVYGMTDEEVVAACQIDEGLVRSYCDREFNFEGNTIKLAPTEFKRIMMIYGAAIDFATEVYQRFIKGREVDFELSIDETLTSTTPEQHFVVAHELNRRNVVIDSLAPRFIGEFQKGIAYIGDITAFENDLNFHAALARAYGYKLSVHSGSDKFSIYPIVGRATQGNFHLKTAGTSWVEAMRVVAIASPSLFREVYQYTLTVFEEARKYYHVSAELTNLPAIVDISDQDLAKLIDQPDVRQAIHITYGLVLTSSDKDDPHYYKQHLYRLWFENQDLYESIIVRHIENHLTPLYEGFK